MRHPALAALALPAALLLPAAIAAPTEAAGAVTAHHSRHWWHCHTSARPCDKPKPPPKKPAVTAAAKRAKVVNAAKRYLGQPYVYGKLDCSSLVDLSYLHGIGKRLPRTAAGIQRVAHRVSRPAPGDVVMWGRPAYHVAIAVGNGRVIVARHSGTRVQYERIWGSPTYGSLIT